MVNNKAIREKVVARSAIGEKKAVKELKEYLRARSKADKDVLWAFLDGDPEAVHALIECVGTKNGKPNVNAFNTWKPKPLKLAHIDLDEVAAAHNQLREFDKAAPGKDETVHTTIENADQLRSQLREETEKAAKKIKLHGSFAVPCTLCGLIHLGECGNGLR